jgi:hypothetical protein
MACGDEGAEGGGGRGLGSCCAERGWDVEERERVVNFRAEEVGEVFSWVLS